MGVPDAAELARLCTVDVGVQVTAEDVKRLMTIGTLDRFDPEQRQDICATVVKELDQAAATLRRDGSEVAASAAATLAKAAGAATLEMANRGDFSTAPTGAS